jgi:hypothetical protein
MFMSSTNYFRYFILFCLPLSLTITASLALNAPHLYIGLEIIVLYVNLSDVLCAFEYKENFSGFPLFLIGYLIDMDWK